MRNGYSIYIKIGRKKLKIPVNPEEIEIKYPTDNKEYSILGVGQVVVPRKPSLKEASWESFFPGDTSGPYVNSGADAPEGYVKAIESAMMSKQKVRLIISRHGSYDTNMRCLISSFEAKDRGGEPGDIYYSISFQEYRDYSPKVVSIVTVPAAGGAPQAEAVMTQERAVEEPVLRVGAAIVANGTYCNDSYGSKPHGTANSLSTTVTRIVDGNPYPVHIGHYGWMKAEQLQITG